MESPKPYGPTNPLLSLSTFFHQHCHRLCAELASRFEDTKRLAGTLSEGWPPVANRRPRSSYPPLFASVTQPKQALAAGLSSEHVAKTLTGTAVYTVSNSNNEFVLISDPNGVNSIGLLCFRQEDAEAFLAQVSNSVSRVQFPRNDRKVIQMNRFSFLFICLLLSNTNGMGLLHFLRNRAESFLLSVLRY